MNLHFKEHLLKSTNSKDCNVLEEIQSLWSGYGKISRYQLKGSSFNTVVVKHIALQESMEHPRGWNTNLSHERKVRSYKVETQWYKEWSKYNSIEFKIPHYLGSYSEGQEQWIILEDLNEEFPLRKDLLNLMEVKVCLKWLAKFHAHFIGFKPIGLWETGTYWHLETRPEEWSKMENHPLKSNAQRINDLLNQCSFQTIVHGDAKLANFCFSENGESVAAVDFQYVGGGCGMKDVAYFLGSCLSGEECERYEGELLDYYFKELKLAAANKNIDSKALKQEWREMYPIACADFTRFLLGWMPTHHKVNDYNLKLVREVLEGL